MKQKHYYLLFTIYLSFFEITKSIECNVSHPILKDGECSLIYCNEEEFNLGQCSINNSIIKTQWLNNIIQVGTKNYRYLNFITTSNNEIFFETSDHPSSDQRIFFGIKEDGSPFFEDSNGIKKYIIKKQIGDNEKKYESEAGLIKINSEDVNYKDREYIIAIGKASSCTEIFNFNNLDEDIQKFKTNDFLGYTSETYIGSTINLTENGKHYFIFALIKESSSQYYFSIVKFKFTIQSGTNQLSYTKEAYKEDYQTANRRMVSCFITEKKIIVGFYYSKTENKYAISLLDTTIQKVKEEDYLLETTTESKYLFYKCIHFKKEIGIFVYYLGTDGESPKIKILEIKENYSLDNYISGFVESLPLSSITTKKDYNYNDIIKLSDNTICFVASSYDKETLIILLINFYQEINYNIRNYIIPLFKLYNYKFLWEINLHRYNQHAIFAFSYCNHYNCSNDDTDEHFSGLMIFSYPNIKETNINLNKYFYENDINYLQVDFTENVNIDNNIFGLVISGIKIIDISENQFKLYSTKSNKDIKNDDIIDKNDLIKIYSSNNEYNEMNYEIKYQPIITEPDYEEYNKYPSYIYKENDSNEKTNFIKTYYYGKIGTFTIIIDNGLTGNCLSKFCDLCSKNDTNYCIVCKNNYTFETNEIYSNFKKCEEIEIETEKSTEGENICTIEMILDNKCLDIDLTIEQYKKIYEELKNNITNWKEKKENIIVQTKNVTFQMATYNEQKTYNNKDISNVDIGKCEGYLKEKYDIKEDLIILKSDIKNEDLTKTFVNYDIYNPNNLEKFDINECKDFPIIISTPVYLNNDVELLYDSLNKSGYNLFDPNDTFYKDVCAPYTTINNTDMILEDRQEILSNYGNNSLCQADCKFISYNSNTKKSSCECKTEDTIINNNKFNISEMFDRNIIQESFLTTIKNSNFLVLKCYKIAIDLNTILTNIGRIIMLFILVIFIILTIIHYIKEKNQLHDIIFEIVSKKLKTFKNQGNKLNYRNKNKKISNDLVINKKIKDKKKHKKNREKKEILIRSIKSNPIKIKNKKDKTKNKSQSAINILKVKKSPKSKDYFSIKNVSSSSKVISIVEERGKNKTVNNNDSTLILETYNDQELNNMEYKKALLYDKRTYFQYYYSLLKKKQLILFSFFPSNDYNLLLIKINLFLVSFSLYFTINGFFFSDSTMHKIYVNKGEYNIIYQIPQILISSAISIIINIILKLLALSEKDIINFKKGKKENKIQEKSKRLIKYLKIKILIFLILSLFLLLFFWYFISCFCGVFSNTQIFLIKDTCVSFLISMIYPFLINLIPGILRIIALRDKKKNRKFLYKISIIVALI